MSRVHDALRRAAYEKTEAGNTGRSVPLAQPGSTPSLTAQSEVFPATVVPEEDSSVAMAGSPVDAAVSGRGPVFSPDYSPATLVNRAAELERLEDIIRQSRTIPFAPAADALLVNPARPKDAPAEEFRSLRTRLNHIQNSQPLHTLVISSASPGEGKSFTACNLAMSQAQLSGKRILLADFDFRRPSIDKLFGIRGAAGLTDYLMGKARLDEIIHRIEDTNLFVIAAGESVSNPLELLNLSDCSSLLEGLRDHFDWVILDSPPLLFAADGNLLATMADGTILVVRIGTTTYDSVTRALQSLCENNVLGIVVNGAHHGELYSRYSYYHSYYYGSESKPEALPASDETFNLEPSGVGKN